MTSLLQRLADGARTTAAVCRHLTGTVLLGVLGYAVLSFGLHPYAGIPLYQPKWWMPYLSTVYLLGGGVLLLAAGVNGVVTVVRATE